MAAPCRDQRFGPTATQGLDKLDGGVQALADELGVGAFGLERFAAGVHDFEIAHEAGAVAVGGQICGTARVAQRALLGGGFIRQVTDGRKAVFDFAEGDENLLPITARTSW